MNNAKPTRVLGYLRVSTAEQADSGAGLDAQRAAIAAEADRRGWYVEYIEDAGYSAKDMRRPGIRRALAALDARDADALVVAKMDRLSRSLVDFASIMQRAQREGWALVALDSPADLTTPSGEAMAGVMAVFAQLERRLISERTKAALAQRKAAGVRLGRARLVPPEVEARARELRAAGLTLARVDQHESPRRMTSAEIARRFEADDVTDPRTPSDTDGWQALSQRHAAASLRLALIEHPDDFEPDEGTDEHEAWQRAVHAARPDRGPSPEDHFKRISDAAARRLQPKSKGRR